METTAATQSAASTGGSRRFRNRTVIGIRWVFPDCEPRFHLFLLRSRTVFGRSPDCDHVLDSHEVSRRHAEVRRDDDGALTLTDLGSTNGVFVNAKSTTQASLRPGDVLRLGDQVGVIVAVSEASQSLASFGAMEGGVLAGPGLQALLEPARRLARTSLTMILVGRTGTGKEMVARMIHEASGREGPFLGLNCAALPEALAEAELFGHARGAFTGADRARPGHFREAHGGTLFLDEIAELGPGLQAKLLRVLEERVVTPLGESRAVPVDVRIVVAAHRPLEQAVADGSFRADLYARLAGYVVHLPPLCERVDEIPFLFTRLLQREAAGRVPEVSARLVEALCLHPWPFNVREMVQVVRRMLALYENEPRLTSDHFREAHPATIPAAPAPASGDQRAALIAAVKTCAGNVTKAASQLGISRGRAYRLLADQDLDRLRDA